jgi:hypothetical protein
MADLTKLNFNPADVEEMGSNFELIPPGTYPVVIIDSGIKDTKAGTGKILSLDYQIVEGSSSGKLIVDRLNIKNQSEMAQKIGLSNLKNICDAIGFLGVLTDATLLHGKPFSVTVEVEDFESNNTGKTLQSNKVVKRMAKVDFHGDVNPQQTEQKQGGW